MKRRAAKAKRYTDRKELERAVLEWCTEYVECRPWMRVIRSDLPHIVSTRTGHEDLARDMYHRLRDVLREAKTLLANVRAPTGYYVSELRRAVTASTKACPHIFGIDVDITTHTKLIDHVDMVRRPPWKPAATIRELAVLSLLAGHGRDWMRERIKKAKETKVASYEPTVIDVLRNEEKAIRQARKRMKK